MPKKTTVSVQMVCSKCRQKVMKVIAELEGITSIVLDPSKHTVTVIGEADPVRIIRKVRKIKRCAKIDSVGPLKEEKKGDSPKKDPVPNPPQICRSCDVWFVVGNNFYSYCPIL